MDAVEFCKTVNRLCKNRDCNVCPAKEKEKGRCMVGFDYYSVKNIEKTISKVEQWAKASRQDPPERVFEAISKCGFNSFAALHD